MPSVKRAWPVWQVDADQAERQAEEQAGQAARRRCAEHRGDRGEGQHHQREVFGRAEHQRELDHQRRHEGQQRSSRSCRRRTSRSRRSPAPARRGPRLAIMLPSIAVTIVADSPGVLSRIDVVEPPIHGAVVDAGEHDERAGRVEAGGGRQQQRDGQRRADAGQHADGGAEGHAERSPRTGSSASARRRSPATVLRRCPCQRLRTGRRAGSSPSARA